MYLDESKIARFSPGEGLVGKAWQDRGTIFIKSVRDTSSEFLRKTSALDDGIESIVFFWCEDRVLEFGFAFRISGLPHRELIDLQIPRFTPTAHHKAFVSPAYPHPDVRSQHQMPGFQPPRDRVSFRMEEVKRHTSKDDAWIVVHGNVYNITNFIKHHPGWMVGSQSSTILAILRNLGKDCTLEFDAIHPDYAVRQLADYRIGELQLAAEPAPSVTFIDFMLCHSGLTAVFIGGTTLAQFCITASCIRNAIRADAGSSLVLETRACITSHPKETSWGLTANLDAFGPQSGEFHEDNAVGACVIGKTGLRRGIASFQFFVQDFAGAMFGVTTCAPDSHNVMDLVLDAQASTLFALAGGLLSSREKIYDPSFNRGQDPEMALVVTVSVDMTKGTVSFVAASPSGQLYNHVEVSRPAWRAQLGQALFPVIFSTHLSLAQFQTGSATCNGILLQ